MDFRSIKIRLLGSLFLLVFSACTPAMKIFPDIKAENVIGIPLSQNSRLQSATQDDSEKIVVYDKTIRKVHHFDLSSSVHLGKYDVDQPEDEHYLIYGAGMKYFVDLTKKRLNIQVIDGDKIPGPIKFVGTPISASYDYPQGYLVVYDSLQTIMIYKIDDNGTILDSFASGPVIKDEGTIQAGDILANGKLVLSIRGNPAPSTGTVVDFLVTVDLAATLSDQNTGNKLVYEKIPTTLVEMSWLAPVNGQPNLVMIRSKEKISIFDLVAKTELSIPTENWVVEKYSKIKDAHIVMRPTYDYDDSSVSNLERRLFYVDAGQLKSKSLNKNYKFILNSHLDLKRGYWSVVKSNTVKEWDVYNSYNGRYTNRTFARVRFDDLLTTIDTDIDDSATVEIANDFLFSLFPSPMGYATRTDIESNKSNILKNFNIKDLK